MAWTTPRTWKAGEPAPSATILNAHVRDNFNAVGDHETWTSFTPNLTAITANPSLGTGATTLGQYIRVGNIVYGAFYIAFGTGSSAGTGQYQIDVPAGIQINGSTIANVNDVTIGNGYAFDNSGSDRWLLTCSVGTASLIRFRHDNQTGAGTGLVTQAFPFAWGDSDLLVGQFRYRTS